MIIDKQRIAAVRTLDTLGYTFTLAEGWSAPHDASGTNVSLLTPEADVMHALLVSRANKLAGCNEGSLEEADPAFISDAVKAYEAKRWPDGKAPNGKG
jgi:hypothetical protein